MNISNPGKLAWPLSYLVVLSPREGQVVCDASGTRYTIAFVLPSGEIWAHGPLGLQRLSQAAWLRAGGEDNE